MVQPNPDLAERKQAGPAAAVERTVSRGLEELMNMLNKTWLIRGTTGAQFLLGSKVNARR